MDGRPHLRRAPPPPSKPPPVVTVPLLADAWRDEGEGPRDLPALLYAPEAGKRPDLLVVCAPGSSGGMGPGIETRFAGLPIEKAKSQQARGSLYRRLGSEWSSGRPHDWDGSPSVGASDAHLLPDGRRAAVLHMTWRHCRGGVKWPGPALKRVASLRQSTDDMVSAAAFMRATFGTGIPLALVGFSFGGPSAMVAGAALTTAGHAPAAVVSIAGSGRGGEAFEDEALATASAVGTVAGAGVPTFFLHGTSDKNVALDVSRYLYTIAAANSAPTTLAVVEGSAHMFDHARDVAYAALSSWIRRLVDQDAASIVPFGPGPSAVTLKRAARASSASSAGGIWPATRAPWGGGVGLGGARLPSAASRRPASGRVGVTHKSAVASGQGGGERRLRLPAVAVGMLKSLRAPKASPPSGCKGWGERASSKQPQVVVASGGDARDVA